MARITINLTCQKCGKTHGFTFNEFYTHQIASCYYCGASHRLIVENGVITECTAY